MKIPFACGTIQANIIHLYVVDPCGGPPQYRMVRFRSALRRARQRRAARQAQTQ